MRNKMINATLDFFLSKDDKELLYNSRVCNITNDTLINAKNITITIPSNAAAELLLTHKVNPILEMLKMTFSENVILQNDCIKTIVDEQNGKQSIIKLTLFYI